MVKASEVLLFFRHLRRLICSTRYLMVSYPSAVDRWRQRCKRGRRDTKPDNGIFQRSECYCLDATESAVKFLPSAPKDRLLCVQLHLVVSVDTHIQLLALGNSQSIGVELIRPIHNAAELMTLINLLDDIIEL